MEGAREVHDSVVLKLTTSSKNIARLATATKFLETNDKNAGDVVFLASRLQPSLFEFSQM